MPADTIASTVGTMLFRTLLSLPIEVRKELAQQLLADTEETAADTSRLVQEADAREGAWTTASSPAAPTPPDPRGGPITPPETHS